MTDVDWNAYAEAYDMLCRLSPYRNLVATVAAKLALTADAVVLDAGCGTGNLLSKLQDTGAALYGIDGSPQMLKRARAKCARGVHFYEHNLNEGLPFTDGQFSHIAAVNVLYALRDPVAFLFECRQLLGSSGRLVIATPKVGYDNGQILRAEKGESSESEWTGWQESAERARLLCERAGIASDVMEAFMRIWYWNKLIQNADPHLFTPETLQGLLEQCRFSVNDISLHYGDQTLVAVATRS